MIWTSHHVLLDGWSPAQVFAEVCDAVRGPAGRRSPAAPFRDYLDWLASRTTRRRRTTGGHRARRATRRRRCRTTAAGRGAPVAVERVGTRRAARRGHRAAAEVARRNGHHREHRCPGRVGAAAVLLLRGTDVVFGTTVSGRPAELPGVESMIGHVHQHRADARPRRRRDRPVRGLAARAAGRAERGPCYEFVALARIQALSGHGRQTCSTAWSCSRTTRSASRGCPGAPPGVVGGVGDATNFPLCLRASLDDGAGPRPGLRPGAVRREHRGRGDAAGPSLDVDQCGGPERAPLRIDSPWFAADERGQRARRRRLGRGRTCRLLPCPRCSPSRWRGRRTAVGGDLRRARPDLRGTGRAGQPPGAPAAGDRRAGRGPGGAAAGAVGRARGRRTRRAQGGRGLRAAGPRARPSERAAADAGRGRQHRAPTRRMSRRRTRRRSRTRRSGAPDNLAYVMYTSGLDRNPEGGGGAGTGDIVALATTAGSTNGAHSGCSRTHRWRSTRPPTSCGCRCCAAARSC